MTRTQAGLLSGPIFPVDLIAMDANILIVDPNHIMDIKVDQTVPGGTMVFRRIISN